MPAAVEGVDVVIEAVPERLALKQDVFERLGQLLPDSMLATNTSVLRIAEIAALTENPERVIGTHWYNPPHLIPLVEVAQSDATSTTDVDWMIGILTQAGKVPVHIRKDTPGFVGNCIQHAMWREAISLVDEGVCDAATADLVVRSSFGLRLAAMGPVENADDVGLDLILARPRVPLPPLCAQIRIHHNGSRTSWPTVSWGQRAAQGSPNGSPASARKPPSGARHI